MLPRPETAPKQSSETFKWSVPDAGLELWGPRERFWVIGNASGSPGTLYVGQNHSAPSGTKRNQAPITRARMYMAQSLEYVTIW